MFVIALSSDPFDFWNEEQGGVVSRNEATVYDDEEAAQVVIDEFGHSHEGEMVWRIKPA